MKNIFVSFTLSLFFIFSACKKTENKNNTISNIDTVQTLVVDSVQVNDSIKINDSLSVKYFSKYLVFPSIKDKKLLDSVYWGNKGMKDYSKQSLQNLLQKEKNDYFLAVKNESKDWVSNIGFAQTWNSDFSMNLKSNVNDYMHIQYLTSSYEGGAHGNYSFSERVFDLKNLRKLELKDITTMSSKKLEELLMKNINKVPSETTDSDGEVKNSEMLLVEIIPATENFYFDNKNLYFHYSPYEIAAYAAGDIVIPVSWDELKGTLNPQFKERMKIK
ncbi:RsiV family protein [Chryseobacterium oryctis]|uniref:RsiV family protein n=1 Tax=Chryseobacterium oryctis TaxID=2952618 RepID=A0ABT3HS94_9FLAO|nr:RsiV family protein [Chryseobacterium oryctis]MCW3162550.1 RsiV family protein [Chryseobacterium oryctis]